MFSLHLEIEQSKGVKRSYYEIDSKNFEVENSTKRMRMNDTLNHNTLNGLEFSDNQINKQNNMTMENEM